MPKTKFQWEIQRIPVSKVQTMGKRKINVMLFAVLYSVAWMQIFTMEKMNIKR